MQDMCERVRGDGICAGDRPGGIRWASRWVDHELGVGKGFLHVEHCGGLTGSDGCDHACDVRVLHKCLYRFQGNSRVSHATRLY